MAASITTDQLTKRFNKSAVAALDKLSISIQPGEVYGFLGANGAGKSTTIRLLLDFLKPTEGAAAIMGLDSVRESVKIKKHVGYLAGDIALYEWATGRELLDYMSSLQPATKYRTVLEKRFQADLDKPIHSLSKGNRQKIGIIQAFMHEPDVLILDEPTSGLDPLMQEAFYKTVEDSQERGAAVLMSSHNLTEAQRVCDRVGIIKHGKLIREQSLKQENILGATIFKVTFLNPEEAEKSKTAHGLTLVSQTDGHTILLKPSGSVSGAIKALAKFEIKDIVTHNVDLEDEFLEFYGDGA